MPDDLLGPQRLDVWLLALSHGPDAAALSRELWLPADVVGRRLAELGLAAPEPSRRAKKAAPRKGEPLGKWGNSQRSRPGKFGGRRAELRDAAIVALRECGPLTLVELSDRLKCKPDIVRSSLAKNTKVFRRQGRPCQRGVKWELVKPTVGAVVTGAS